MKLPAAWRPMVPWAVAAVLCAPLALSLLVFSLLVEPGTELPPELAGYAELLDRDFAPPPEDAPADENLRRGVVFASSGLACAITGAKRLPGARVDLVALWVANASLLHFRPLIDPTIAMRPDFVIVQSTLLVATPKNAPPNAASATHYFWRRQVLALMPGLVRLGLLGDMSTRAPKRATPLLQCNPKTMPREQWRNRKTDLIVPLVDRRRDQTRAILLRFAEAGIPVLVVPPPVNAFTEAYYTRVSEALRSITGPAAGAAAIYVLEPSKPWPNEQFVDPLHMDPNQAGSYRAWLSATILAALGN